MTYKYLENIAKVDNNIENVDWCPRQEEEDSADNKQNIGSFPSPQMPD